MNKASCEQRERFLAGRGRRRHRMRWSGGRADGRTDGWMWVHFNQRDCLFARTLMTASGAARPRTHGSFVLRPRQPSVPRASTLLPPTPKICLLLPKVDVITPRFVLAVVVLISRIRPQKNKLACKVAVVHCTMQPVNNSRIFLPFVRGPSVRVRRLRPAAAS